MLLCDAAQAVDGKLFVLGGGWSLTNAGAVRMALAIKIEVPWSEANRRQPFRLSLRDEDGAAVAVDGPHGAVPVEVEGELEVGRPPGLPQGTPLDVPMAINLGPVALAPSSRFEWRLEIDGRSEPDWHVSFMTKDDP